MQWRTFWGITRTYVNNPIWRIWCNIVCITGFIHCWHCRWNGLMMISTSYTFISSQHSSWNQCMNWTRHMEWVSDWNNTWIYVCNPTSSICWNRSRNYRIFHWWDYICKSWGYIAIRLDYTSICMSYWNQFSYWTRLVVLDNDWYKTWICGQINYCYIWGNINRMSRMLQWWDCIWRARWFVNRIFTFISKLAQVWFQWRCWTRMLWHESFWWNTWNCR